MSGTMLEQPGARPAAGLTWGARDVSVRGDSARALDRVTLAVPAGQVTAVVGGDGAGKTTLLRCLAGTRQPDAGEIRVPARNRIGYLPDTSGTYPDLTVAENLAFRAAAYGMPGPAARQRAASLTELAGLTAARDRRAGQLSGGMRQKLGVICALLHEPDLLILDEPTTGVDPVSRAGLWQLIAGAAASGAAVVLSTTYLAEAERAASVLVLDVGQALAAGTPAEILAAVPGAIVAPAGPPAPAAWPLSWRRGGRWLTWSPPGTGPAAGQPITPDLQDAVTVAALAREAAASAATGPGAATAAQAGPETAASAGIAATIPLAECVAVTRRFGAHAAVRDVSLAVGPGEIVGLLGANGAGKTTLIRMLLGLLPASAGTIALFGAPPSRDSRRRIGYVPQGLGLYDDLTVPENLRFSAAVFGTAPGTVPAGLGNRAGAVVGGLPLGLQRRAAFAQALAHHPDLLVLDEPTSGVDPLGRARLWETIRSAAEAGAGVLVTTHYMEEAYECDRLVIMADGAVVAGGTPAGVTAGATVTLVEMPDWQAAFGLLASRGLDVTLAGHALRVPAASPAEVRALLSGAAAESAAAIASADGARVTAAPATLEERFFQLVAASGKDR